MTTDQPTARLPLATRVVAAIIAPVLFLAAAILYGFPRDTAQLFAWPVKPPMTALVMGAGYFAGGCYFVSMFFARQWHTVAPTLTGIAVFATSMLIATLLHWDRFTHSHPTFWLWAGIYATTPFVVWTLVFLNRRLDRGKQEGRYTEMPMPVRVTMGLLFVGFAILGPFLFLAPDLAATVWPWTITPLTSRVLGAWVAVVGVGGLHMVTDRRWSTWRITMRTAILWFALVFFAILRDRESFTTALGFQVFTASMIFLLISFLVVYVAFERRRGVLNAPLETAS